MRKHLRAIAKARMKCMGMGNVNKKFSLRNGDGVPIWKLAVTGKTGEDARRAQMNYGKLMVAQKKGRKTA